jgi:uncharacterized protein (DUF1684 family)
MTPSGTPHAEHDGHDWSDVVDWRRRVAELYRAVREEPDLASAHAAWSRTRADLLATHPASPVAPSSRRGFRPPPVAPYDPAYRFVVPVDGDVEPERRDVTTGTDGVVSFDLVGRVTLPGLGRLDLWWCAGYGGGLFLPLRDGTSGAASYGGGRYVLDTVKGADLGGDRDALVVDLNFAYAPSCAHDESWACPLPGPGNRLDAPVPVGELAPVRGA